MTIAELVSKYHWASIAEDGVLELFLDHHSLSSYRTCEAYFELSILKNYQLKSTMQPWSLKFGSLFHKMIELIYETKATGAFNYDWLVSKASEDWREGEFDKYRDHKTYQALGGLPGFVLLLAQYCEFYSNDNERLRPIGVELAFGKGKEVPLGKILLNRSVRCYLAGRIDFLMDSGSAIGPMDHKTKAFFKGNPAEDHDPQEGMTGYVYASRCIIKNKFPELLENRRVDRIWMNYVQVKAEADFNKRFKRIPIFKTDYQLEQFRLRQLATFAKILEFTLSERVADWNTSICSNMFFQPCPFKHVHNKNTAGDQLRILQNDFRVAAPWDPSNVESRDKGAEE